MSERAAHDCFECGGSKECSYCDAEALRVENERLRDCNLTWREERARAERAEAEVERLKEAVEDGRVDWRDERTLRERAEAELAESKVVYRELYREKLKAWDERNAANAEVERLTETIESHAAQCDEGKQEIERLGDALVRIHDAFLSPTGEHLRLDALTNGSRALARSGTVDGLVQRIGELRAERRSLLITDEPERVCRILHQQLEIQGDCLEAVRVALEAVWPTPAEDDPSDEPHYHAPWRES